MRRILVVAHQTLGGEHLLEEVARRRRAGDCRVHLVVPVQPPGIDDDGTDLAASVRAEAAAAVLADGLRRMRALDAAGAGTGEVIGEVGDADPVAAVQALRKRGDGFDELILSTLPPGPSRWLRTDVPRRMAKAFPGTPVFHVLGALEPVGAP